MGWTISLDELREQKKEEDEDARQKKRVATSRSDTEADESALPAWMNQSQ
jgi:hypothetical protein